MTDRVREAVERLRAYIDGLEVYVGTGRAFRPDVHTILAALEAAEQLNERLVKRTGDCTIQIDHLLRQVAAMEPVVRDGLRLAGGWREAIVMLEDFCGEPVRLKNMIAAADQLDDWVKRARATQSARHTDTEGANG